MNTVNTHYPEYSVMEMSDEWDEHTRIIVEKRLGPFPKYKFINEKEARYLAIIAEHLIYDDRKEIQQWIVHHIDQSLAEVIGEAQRKVNTPPEQQLIREGLLALDHVSKLTYAKEFGDLDKKQQFNILAALDKGKTAQIPEWSQIPQKELFKKILGLVSEAYYSHPVIWSEIGYGGPVYPMSYVRIEYGLTDPWEAKLDGK